MLSGSMMRKSVMITGLVVFDSNKSAEAAWETLGKAAIERVLSLGGSVSLLGGPVVHHLYGPTGHPRGSGNL